LVDVLSKLQPASFKGIGFPCSSLDFGFSQEQAEHKFIFRDEALIQKLGRKNKTWRLEIPFRENLFFLPGYEHLYSKTFPDFLVACQDGSPGELVTPDVGTVRAACVSFSYTIDPTKRDGVDVHVEFISAPLANDQGLVANIPTVEAIAVQAKRLDTAVAATDFNPPKSHASVPQDRPTGFSDPFSAVTSAADQLSNSRRKSLARIDDTTYRINKMNDSLDRIGDPKNWLLKREANDLINALTRARAHSDSGGKRIRQAFIDRSTPVNVVASKYKMTLPDFYRLNPEFSTQPTVPANSIVRYYMVA
jgi:hypothetical protein